MTPLRQVPHAACYCGAACRAAVKRVLDREQKWLARGVLRGDQVCARELERRRIASTERRDWSWQVLLERHRRER